MANCVICGKETPEGIRICEDCSKKTGSKQERDAETLSLFELVLENAVLESQLINAGNNGLIFKLDIQNLSPEDLKLFEEMGVEMGTENVIKMIKVYLSGVGQQEFEMHKSAHEVVPNNPDEFAQIPTPRLYYDLGMTDDGAAALKERLKGQNTNFSDRIEIIMMDYVEGDDLAEIMFREAIFRKMGDTLPRVESADDLKNESMDALIQMAASALEYEDERDVRGVTPEERDQKAQAVMNRNLTRLFDFLYNDGFEIDASISERLKNTFNVLHENGLVHQDAHERNVMIQDGVPFLIDFGAAVSFEGDYSAKKSGLYVDEKSGGQRPTDEELLIRIKPLTTPGKDRKRQETRKDVLQLSEKINRMAESKQWEGGYGGYYKRLVAGDDSVEVLSRLTAPFDINDAYEMFAFLTTAIQEGLVESNDAAAAVRVISKNVTVKKQDYNNFLAAIPLIEKRQ